MHYRYRFIQARTLWFFILALSLTMNPFEGYLLAQTSSEDVQIARIKYRGGGDWYNDPSSLNNLLRFTAETVPLGLSNRYRDIDLGSTIYSNSHSPSSPGTGI